MKKLIFILCLGMLIILLAIVSISSQRTYIEEVKYYSILRSYSYCYRENKKMELEIYTNVENSPIMFPENNRYSLTDHNNNYQLQNVEVQNMGSYHYQNEEVYKLTIYADLIKPFVENLVMEECILEVKNMSFTLEQKLGFFAVYLEEYPILDFKELYGHYSYIDGELYMVGITLMFPKRGMTLESLNIGNAYASLEFIEADKIYDSELPINTIKHQVLTERREESSYELSAKQGYYFIPISYPYLTLITQAAILLTIDHKTFVIEDFCYLANNISLMDYPGLQIEGKIKDA